MRAKYREIWVVLRFSSSPFLLCCHYLQHTKVCLLFLSFVWGDFFSFLFQWKNYNALVNLRLHRFPVHAEVFLVLFSFKWKMRCLCHHLHWLLFSVVDKRNLNLDFSYSQKCLTITWNRCTLLDFVAEFFNLTLYVLPFLFLEWP